MATAIATTELEMVRDARRYLLANGGTEDELAANQALINRYAAEGTSPIAAAPWPVQRTGGPKVKRAVKMAQSGQISYATDLLGRLWGHDREVLAELVGQLPGRTKDKISDQIDNLLSILASQPRLANPTLQAHLRDMWSRKMVDADGNRDEAKYQAFVAKLPTLTQADGEKLAAQLRDLADRPARTPAKTEVGEGMYRDGDGMVYKVQVAHQGSGKLYAKQMTKLEHPRIVRGQEVHYGFVYVPGLINRIRPEWQMTLADAQEWGKLYGCCIRCGAVLTDEVSRDNGVGPVCAKKF